MVDLSTSWASRAFTVQRCPGRQTPVSALQPPSLAQLGLLHGCIPALPVANDALEVGGRGELASLNLAVHLASVRRLFIWHAPMYGPGRYILRYVEREVEICRQSQHTERRPRLATLRRTDDFLRVVLVMCMVLPVIVPP